MPRPTAIQSLKPLFQREALSHELFASGPERLSVPGIDSPTPDTGAGFGIVGESGDAAVFAVAAVDSSEVCARSR